MLGISLFIITPTMRIYEHGTMQPQNLFKTHKQSIQQQQMINYPKYVRSLLYLEHSIVSTAGNDD